MHAACTPRELDFWIHGDPVDIAENLHLDWLDRPATSCSTAKVHNAYIWEMHGLLIRVLKQYFSYLEPMRVPLTFKSRCKKTLTWDTGINTHTRILISEWYPMIWINYCYKLSRRTRITENVGLYFSLKLPVMSGKIYLWCTMRTQVLLMMVYGMIASAL